MRDAGFCDFWTDLQNTLIKYEQVYPFIVCQNITIINNSSCEHNSA
jgi:hypothetical protein